MRSRARLRLPRRRPSEHAAAVYGYLRRRVPDGSTAEGLTHRQYRAGLRPGGRPASRSTSIERAALLARAHGCGPLARPMGLTARRWPCSPGPSSPGLRTASGPSTPARQRILTLHYLDQLAPAEVAAVLDLAPSAVQSRLAAALRALTRRSTTASGGAPSIEAISAA